VGPCLAFEGATSGEVFEAYLERFLAPALRPGQVVVMDNRSSHKGSGVRELIEGRGCELVYLPPCSPDLNPIERAFSKLEASLRRAGAGTFEALVEATGWALDGITDRDALGFFRHCGYRAPAPTAMTDALDPEHPLPPRPPAPYPCRELVSQILPTDFSYDEGAVLVVGARGPDVALEHQIALSCLQRGGVGFQAQPARHAPVSRGDSLGPLFGLLLGHRSQNQRGKDL
jgi:transposase